MVLYSAPSHLIVIALSPPRSRSPTLPPPDSGGRTGDHRS
jgi:hypothetical protein